MNPTTYRVILPTDDDAFPCAWHNARFADLEPQDEPHDTRVSPAEQQDHMPSVGAPAAWQVIGLGLSPLIIIGLVSLVSLAINYWK